MAIQKPQPRLQPSPAAAQPLTRPVARASAGAPRTVSGPAKFVRATTEAPDRLIVSVCGDQKSGKNHFGFTAPAPIYLHSFDQGLEGVVNKFAGSKEIYVAEYELEVQPGQASPQEVAESADKLWQQFVNNYRESLEQCGHGTVVLDTDTEVYELIRLARFGKLTQIMPHMYGPVNAEFRDLIRSAFDHRCNVFLIGKMGDEWINDAQGKGSKTGNRIRKGFSELPYLTQVNCLCERVDREGGGSDFQVTIYDCRSNPDANGLAIPNDYEMLRATVLGG